jgi:hypothetical protein
MAAKLIRPLFLSALLTLGGCKDKAPPKSIDVTLGGEAFTLELALTPEQIQQGLMHREALGDHEGMIFVFPDVAGRYFWMKNCLIPLDVIFADGAGRVVSVRRMEVPKDNDNPPSYSSRWPAQFAIEVSAGRAEELSIAVGDRLELPLEELKKLVE